LGSVSFRAKNTLHKLSICNKMTDMVSLIELLRSKYPKLFPVYLRNTELTKFLNENREEIEWENFRELRDFYAKHAQTRKFIFNQWEEENKQLLDHKEQLKKANREFPQEREFRDLLAIRQYSRKTIKAYTMAIRSVNEYMKAAEKILISQASKEQLHKYFMHLTDERKVSVSTVRIARFAIEYYRSEVICEPVTLDFAYGLRKKEHLPTIFSKWEIAKILNATNNLKHKLVLSLLYSAGLRLNEVIHLKVKDIDLQRKTIFVREGKGGKDRISVLSEKLISDLSVFMDNRLDKDILFPSNQKSDSGKEKPLSARTVQKILSNALVKSGIRKHGTPHDLRHSFATHLLETGTDIHFIQKLLGHQNLSTTTIYTRLANPKIAGVKSPL
jgi:integrase/recombinase XerD